MMLRGDVVIVSAVNCGASAVAAMLNSALADLDLNELNSKIHWSRWNQSWKSAAG